MPEIKWVWGYPAAIFFMLIAGGRPLCDFRKKGWLD
jgi:magnesium transporter